jgi:hypothetical protein
MESREIMFTLTYNGLPLSRRFSPVACSGVLGRRIVKNSGNREF